MDLFCCFGNCYWVVWVGCLVGVFFFDNFFGVWIDIVGGYSFYGDVVFDWVDIDIQVVVDVFFVDYFEFVCFVDYVGDCLVGGVFIGDMIVVVLDVQILIDFGFGNVVEVKMLLVGVVWYSKICELVD